ncbi:oxysterol-binding protein-like protein [Aulographum hederae CBS 113979]|uniref:Oxysterol-binding protein-like protein n=1 Tax=Aulographum hederae CBS 113979 TaxID=1176131 RepID=A0A6G1H542_9PEZI|nr:oxysterol-binding protein-like protein [Aulographum hederae CBS 113979]
MTGLGQGSAVSSVPDTAAASSATETTNPPGLNDAPAEKPPDDSSKLKTFLGLLRKFIGVSDLAAVRFSLPAQLLEPTPNLEYWNYLDRPETFISIGDSEEPLGRMLGALRFWFTKDLKYVKGKPVKPYNSVLGEFFRCTWEVEDDLSPPQTSGPSKSAPKSGASSVKSESNKKTDGSKPIKISYLTEQTSHHPPVSAFMIDCPDKGIFARGYDQLSAKFTGTSIRVTAGNHNYGIFITLKNRGDEMYQLTHPAAHLGGLLRGTLSVSVADHCYISCPKTKIKTILHYVEEGWLGKTQNKVLGVIFNYDPDNDTKTKLKDVPDKDILGRLEGAWTDKIYYTLGKEPFDKVSDKNKYTLIDLNPLFPIPKVVPPQSVQLPNESQKFWDGVTNAIVNKQYSLATTIKQELEENQRVKAAERKSKGVEFQPRFFTGAVTPVGKPELTGVGRRVVEGLREGRYELEEGEEA